MKSQIGTYKRKILYTNHKKGIQIVETIWNPGMRTRWHDHAESDGVSIVREGMFLEERRMKNNRTKKSLICSGEKLEKCRRTAKKSGTIHRITCMPGEIGIIHHIYFPPLDQKKVQYYDEP